jgi:hypothetical protein
VASIYEIDVGDRVLEIEGDRPPTRAEIDSYLGKSNQPANKLVEYAKPREQKEREALAGADAILAAEYPNAGITPSAAQAGDITTTGQALAKKGKQASMDVLPTVARIGVPLAATFLSGGAALPVAAAFTGTGALLGEEAARTIEGRAGQTPLEGTQTMMLGGTMAPLKVAPGLARTVMGGALEGSALATQGTGEMPWSQTGAVGAGLDIGARMLENRFLKRATLTKEAQTARTYRAIGDEVQADSIAKFQAGVNDVPNTAGVLTPVDEALAAPGKARDFDLARNEQAAQDLQESLRAKQLAGDESIVIENPIAAQQAKLDVNLGEGQGAVKERARLAAQADATPEARAARQAEAAAAPPDAPLSPQAQRMMEQYGRTNPAVMYAIARGGAGFAYGFSQGDTPEEKLGYGLTYALAGSMASPALAKTMGQKLLTGTSIGRNWVPEATLQPFMEAIRQRGRDYEAALIFPKVAKDKLTKALDAYKDPVKRTEANKLVYEYLTGSRAITTLPADLAGAATDARLAIDELSDQLIVSGLATGRLKDSIVANMGAYLRRSYRVFTDPKFTPDQEVLDRWVGSHVKEALADPANTKTAQELRSGYIKQGLDLTDRKVAEQFITGNRASVDSSIFKPRKKLDAVTRELLGEIDDPLVLLSDTAPRMARNMAVYESQKQMADIGEKLGIFTREPGPEAGRWVRLADDDAKYNGLAGLYTSPEVRQAFDSISKVETSKAIQTFALLSAASKMPKTLGSLKAYASNVWGGAMDVVAQGHALQFGNLDNLKTAKINAFQSLGIANNSGAINQNAALKLYREMVRAGMVNKAISGSDFLRTLETGTAGKSLGMAGKALTTASKVYMLPETLSKVFNLAGETKALREAGLSQADAFQQAAAKVRATTADYDYLPGIIRKGALFGAIDPFIAYTADRFRVVYNTYRIAGEELASGNPVLRARGAKRMASMTAVLAAASVIGANRHLSPEQEEALRRRMPDRDRNGFLKISDIKPDGSFTYTNLNYTIPQSIVTEAAAAAQRGDSPDVAAGNFLQSLGQQLFGANLVYAPIARAALNEKESGGPVRSANDPMAKQVADTGKYLATEMFMPLVFNEARKWRDIPIQQATEAGSKYTREDLLLSNIGGIRLYRKDLDESFRGDASRLRRALTDDQITYTSAKRRALTEPDKQGAYQTFETRRQAVHEQAVQIVNDARVLGASDEKVIGLLKEGGVPSRMIAGAMDGIYIPTAYEDKRAPSDYIEEWILGGVKNDAQFRSKVDEVAKTDPRMARNIINEYRSQQREQTLGIKGTDMLIKAYDEQDGSRARYLAEKYRKVVEADGRDAAVAYLKEMRTKRVLTPIVQQQVFEILQN